MSFSFLLLVFILTFLTILSCASMADNQMLHAKNNTENIKFSAIIAGGLTFVVLLSYFFTH